MMSVVHRVSKAVCPKEKEWIAAELYNYDKCEPGFNEIMICEVICKQMNKFNFPMADRAEQEKFARLIAKLFLILNTHKTPGKFPAYALKVCCISKKFYV